MAVLKRIKDSMQLLFLNGIRYRYLHHPTKNAIFAAEIKTITIDT